MFPVKGWPGFARFLKKNIGKTVYIPVMHDSRYILIPIPVPIPGKVKSLIPVPIPARSPLIPAPFGFLDSGYDSSKNFSDSGINFDFGIVHHCYIPYVLFFFGGGSCF